MEPTGKQAYWEVCDKGPWTPCACQETTPQEMPQPRMKNAPPIPTALACCCAEPKRAHAPNGVCACEEKTTQKERPSIVETQSFKQAAIQRMHTPVEALRALEQAGIDPKRLRPVGKTAVTLNEATYTALAEVMLGRTTLDPKLGTWQIVATEPVMTVLEPGLPMRPSFEEIRAGHFDSAMWLLMGGTYATGTTSRR